MGSWMDRKTQQILAVVVIIIVIIAGLAIVLLNNEPETSEARTIILDANDVKASTGEYWWQIQIGDMPYLDDVNATSEAFSFIRNESILTVDFYVNVFDNGTSCHQSMLNGLSMYTWNVTASPIGDESYNLTTGDPSLIWLAFREGRALIWISLTHYNAESWLYESAVQLAELQLEKIDQYLAEHPGAS
jgi:hypothetical protein